MNGKTRRKSMTYNKPKLVTLESSLEAICGTAKGDMAFETLLPPSDPKYGLPTLSINAYEADE
jgi:hypothetical protein